MSKQSKPQTKHWPTVEEWHSSESFTRLEPVSHLMFTFNHCLSMTDMVHSSNLFDAYLRTNYANVVWMEKSFAVLDLRQWTTKERNRMLLGAIAGKSCRCLQLWAKPLVDRGFLTETVDRYSMNCEQSQRIIHWIKWCDKTRSQADRRVKSRHVLCINSVVIWITIIVFGGDRHSFGGSMTRTNDIDVTKEFWIFRIICSNKDSKSHTIYLKFKAQEKNKNRNKYLFIFSSEMFIQFSFDQNSSLKCFPLFVQKTIKKFHIL